MSDYQAQESVPPELRDISGEGKQPTKQPSRSVLAQAITPSSSTGQQPFLLSSQPVKAKRTKPPPARPQGLPPPSRASIRQNRPSSIQQPQDQQHSRVLVDVSYDENIPGICRNDVLDKRIGLRPRQKQSTELRQLINPQYTCSANGASLPNPMKMIIQQFMVAQRLFETRRLRNFSGSNP